MWHILRFWLVAHSLEHILYLQVESMLFTSKPQFHRSAQRSNKIADSLIRLFSVFSFSFDTYYIPNSLWWQKKQCILALRTWIRHHTGHHFIYPGQSKIRLRAFWRDINIKANAKRVASTMWLIMQCPRCESKAWLSTGCHKQGLQSLV